MTQNREQTWKVPRSCAPVVHRRLREELLEAIAPALFGDLWKAQQLVAEFERQFGREMGYAHVSAVQSGSAALQLSLLACGVEPGDEVITVANSDIATTAAISHCGAVPVLCDVRESDYTMDPDRVEALITERTVGLLPVDLYGHPCDGRRLRQIADRHGLFLVEDTAIATGARDHGQPIGAFADAAAFSCSPHKPFEGVGNGGLITTGDPDLWERVELLKGFGLHAGTAPTPPVYYHHVAEGYNLRMNPVDAAVLTVKLPHLQQWSDKRRVIGGWYAERLATVEGVQLPTLRPEAEPIFRTYTIRVPARDAVYRRLQAAGVQAALHYVPPVHQQPVYRDRALPGADHLPVTEKLAPELLSLPVDPEFGPAEVDYVYDQLRRILDEVKSSGV
jgi:dTDP-4-amino-4,6-dideoxygalactose transaminase